MPPRTIAWARPAPADDAPPEVPPWVRVRVWAAAHAVDDLYQGLVPAMVPFFVLERDYSYAQASGLAMAATLGSALPQLLIGVIADRQRVRWLPAAGLLVAGTGVGTAGLAPAYAAVFALVLLSGLGVAMFHPPAGREAREAAQGSATAMSYFAAGGSVGFFLAPALATPALAALGLRATVLFLPPCALMALVIHCHQRRAAGAVRGGPTTSSAADRPLLFGLLTVVEVIRSTVSFGISTFISLYWIGHLGASATLGGAALTLVLAGGVIGTLLGGRIADRLGLVRTVRLGNLAVVPALLALLLCTDPYAALALALLVGVATNIPFAVLIKLGQDYLPSRPGTAAGVTLGLAVSAGGLLQPVLGVIADRHGPQASLLALACIPLLAGALSLGLSDP